MPSESTVKQYEKVINGLAGRGIKDLSKVDSVLTAIRKKKNGEPASKATIAQQLSAIMWKIGDKDPAWKKYREEMMKANEENVAGKEYKKTEKSVDWSDLSSLYKKEMKGNKKGNILMAFYSLNPPRRIQDYALMKVVDEEPEDTSYNYLVRNDDKPYFVFNKYKTAKIYGKQIFKLSGAMKDYYETHKIGSLYNNQFLFSPSGTDPVLPNNLSRFLAHTTMKASDEKIRATSNTYRHAYISEFLKGNPTTDERKKVATMMGHSSGMQLEYDEREEEEEEGEEEPSFMMMFQDEED